MVQEQLEEVRQNIRNACERSGRKVEDVTLIAVSKTKPVPMLQEAYDAGARDFGENKVKELRDKYYNISFQYSGKMNWHFVGHLQTNKVKDIVAFIHLIHSVDSFNLAEEIERCAKKINKKIDVLVQVNSSREPQKYGVEPENAENLCKQISLLENVNVKGLMTMAKLTDDREEIRKNFRETRQIYESLSKELPDLKYLSMGMTQDFDIAIEEGANMLRIGTAIFGERNAV